MTEHGICAKCKKSVGCPYADDRITGCKNFVLEPELKLTSKEWLRQCNTEQLAEFLWNYTHDVIGDYERIRNPILREMPLKNILGNNCTKKEAWVDWLKQLHREE